MGLFPELLPLCKLYMGLVFGVVSSCGRVCNLLQGPPVPSSVLTSMHLPFRLKFRNRSDHFIGEKLPVNKEGVF